MFINAVKFFLFLSALIATNAWPQNGISIFQYPFSTNPTDGNMQVPCLGEGVGIDAIVTDRFQVVATAAGTFHLVSNWTIEGTATGQFSGFEWFVHGASPLSINTKDGQYAETVQVKVVFEPLNGGPKLKSNEDIRLRTDADGNVRVAVLKVKWACLGQG